MNVCLLGFTHARTYARKDLSVVLRVPSMVPRVLTAQASIMSHLGRPWGVLGLPWGAHVLNPYNCHQIQRFPRAPQGPPKDLPRAPLGPPLGPLGLPWAPLGPSITRSLAHSIPRSRYTSHRNSNEAVQSMFSNAKGTPKLSRGAPSLQDLPRAPLARQ